MRRGNRRAGGAVGGLAVVGTVVMVGGLVLTSTAWARGEQANKIQKPTKVVKEVVRGSFGQILTDKEGHTLYVEPGGTCTGSCLSVWPPLLMPRNKTIPGGVASGLGTVSTSAGLQVTYDAMPLYTFASDTKTSTSGENVGGFVVAQVSAPAP